MQCLVGHAAWARQGPTTLERDATKPALVDVKKHGHVISYLELAERRVCVVGLLGMLFVRFPLKEETASQTLIFRFHLTELKTKDILPEALTLSFICFIACYPHFYWFVPSRHEGAMFASPHLGPFCTCHFVLHRFH